MRFGPTLTVRFLAVTASFGFAVAAIYSALTGYLTGTIIFGLISAGGLVSTTA